MKKQTTLDEIVGNQPIFFKPNTEFVKWLLKYANDRIIIDAGSGKKFLLTQQLIKNGAKKVIALDLNIDVNELLKFRMLQRDLFLISFHAMGLDMTEKMTEIYTTDTKDILIIFARPCHSDWVEKVLDKKGKEVEALYITLPENLTKYNDLGKWKDKAVLLEHEGSSADKEVVYSIK